MATVVKEISTLASPDRAWDAIRDVGALHTRLVPGFVVATRMEAGARIVTFGNGMTVREPIITIDDAAKRLVGGSEGGRTTHYNASVQVFAHPEGGARVVWIADFLPEEITPQIEMAMSAGSQAMQAALDGAAIDPA